MQHPIRRLVLSVCLTLSPFWVQAETLRVATYNVGLSRDGPGLLLRDLGREPDEALSGVLAVIREVRPDILALTRFDHDHGGRALQAFAALLAEGPDGIDYPHSFGADVNAGEPSGFDLDGDGLLMGWNDAFGWGKYPGHGGMAILSRHPLDTQAARTFRELLWRDMPAATLPSQADGAPWPHQEGAEILRLSSRSHWDVPLEMPDGGRLHLLFSNPTPPLFDGEEMLNRLRNRDEIRFWAEYLGGHAFIDDQGREAAAPEAPVIVLGDLNRDPADGAGLPGGIETLLAHPRLTDPQPRSAGGAAAANEGHSGDPGLDTADWRDEDGPGNLRVDYVLPDARLNITGAGVFWPAPGAPLADEAGAASAHRLVWIDVALR